MNVDEINKVQEDSLASLRERIAARKKQFEEDASVPFVVQKRLKKDVPELPEDIDSNFKYERYVAVVERAEVLYNNYLVARLELQENPTVEISQQEFERALKDVCRAFDDLVEEVLKPRFGI